MYDGFLKWRIALKWSLMTWMTWGYRHQFGNLHNIHNYTHVYVLYIYTYGYIYIYIIRQYINIYA